MGTKKYSQIKTHNFLERDEKKEFCVETCTFDFSESTDERGLSSLLYMIVSVYDNIHTMCHRCSCLLMESIFSDTRILKKASKSKCQHLEYLYQLYHQFCIT